MSVQSFCSLSAYTIYIDLPDNYRRNVKRSDVSSEAKKQYFCFHKNLVELQFPDLDVIPTPPQTTPPPLGNF